MFWRKNADLAKISAITLLVALILISLSVAPTSELEYRVDSVDLTVYRDGLVHVTQALTVNETYPSISLALLATAVENVLVLDENQTLLDYKIEGSRITVFSLGAKAVFLGYDTILLTEKKADVWTLIIDNPYNFAVCLPEESTIMYLNALPTSIDTKDGKIILSFVPGIWEISYVLPILIPASFRISGLTVTPTEVELGDEVTITATVTNIGNQEGPYTVGLEINGVVEETKTLTLAGGATTTIEFTVIKEDAGTYIVEIGELKSEFTVKQPPPAPFPTDYLIVIGVILVTGGAGVFTFLRRRGPVRAEKILKDRPDLRQEDRDVIQFLAQRGGKAFETEIREAFPDLPRTTLWRLVRRLEKMEIVYIKKVGLQNQIELKKQGT